MDQGTETVNQQPVCTPVCTDTPTEKPPRRKGGRPVGAKDAPAELRLRRDLLRVSVMTPKQLRAIQAEPDHRLHDLVELRMDKRTRSIYWGMVKSKLLPGAPDMPKGAVGDPDALNVNYVRHDHIPGSQPMRSIKLRFANERLGTRDGAPAVDVQPLSDEESDRLAALYREAPRDDAPQSTFTPYADGQAVQATDATAGNVNEIPPTPEVRVVVREVDAADILAAVQTNPGQVPTPEKRKLREVLMDAWESIGLNPRVRDRRLEQREVDVRRRENKVAEAEAKLNQALMLGDDCPRGVWSDADGLGGGRFM